jgi:hypothetical protein
MKKKKVLSPQNLVIVILSVLLLASIVLGVTGAWFTDKIVKEDQNLTFGTIELSDVKPDAEGNTFINRRVSGAATAKLMPGDQLVANFALKLTDASEASWVRFSIVVTSDVDTKYPALDEVAPEAEGYSAYVERTNLRKIIKDEIAEIQKGMLNVYDDDDDFSVNGGFVYKLLPMVNSDSQINMNNKTYIVPAETTTNELEGITVTFKLQVDAIQAANNGAWHIDENTNKVVLDDDTQKETACVAAFTGKNIVEK